MITRDALTTNAEPADQAGEPRKPPIREGPMNRIIHWLQQKMRAGTPYECYWRDRAFEAERELKRTQALLRLAMKTARTHQHH